ncbi:MAG: DUF4263 domain-containing protein [Bacteroidetes bacterium]|nr:DUF4263 domain-containing protein [Bacteroidota bacterium]
MKRKGDLIELDNAYLSNWDSLNQPVHPLKKTILKDWKDLLAADLKEEAYHKFLSEHAGFFFKQDYPDNIVISKMKFGADFVSDFVICYDKGSDGFEYELIELETPASALFTKYDKIAARLNSAIQQIQSWRAWLLKHSGSIKNIFPSNRYDIDGYLNLKYTIIIGKREAMSDYQIKSRNLLSVNLGISIRSFDYLSNLLQKGYFRNEFEFINDMDNEAAPYARDFANPFYKAYSDQQWRQMIKTKGFSGANMIASNVKQLMEFREYNTIRLNQFRDYQKKLLK